MDKRTRAKTVSGLTAVLMTVLTFSVLVADTPKPLPDPDGKPANMAKPVQVFILLGQSNMLGFGKIGAADKPGSLARWYHRAVASRVLRHSSTTSRTAAKSSPEPSSRSIGCCSRRLN